MIYVRKGSGRMNMILSCEQNSHDMYQVAMKNVRRGMENDVWSSGSLNERRLFVQNCLEARILGVQEHVRTGRAQTIPELQEVNGSLVWGMTQSARSMQHSAERSVSRYEAAVQQLGVFEDDASQDVDFEK